MEITDDQLLFRLTLHDYARPTGTSDFTEIVSHTLASDLAQAAQVADQYYNGSREANTPRALIVKVEELGGLALSQPQPAPSIRPLEPAAEPPAVDQDKQDRAALRRTYDLILSWPCPECGRPYPCEHDRAAARES